jgi:V8-like Glu-specific endopeptidase
MTLATGTAQAQDTAADSAVTGGTSVSSAQVENYWTSEHMQDATPASVPAATSAVPPVTPSTTTTASRTVSRPGGLPAGATATPQGVTPQALTYFWQSKVWAAHGVAPASTMGKLYFNDTSGVRHWCTATAIASDNSNTIWTAGHCLTDGNKHWYSSFLFAPDYHDALWPYGTWSAKTWAAPNGYFDGGNSYYDMGELALNLNSSGQRVGNVVGYQGYMFGDGYAGRTWIGVRQFGYSMDTHPARSDISPYGHDLRFCVGDVATPAYEEMDCDIGHGGSGGPSIYDLQTSRGWGYIIGHNSFQRSLVPHVNFGPQLGQAALNVHSAEQAD